MSQKPIATRRKICSKMKNISLLILLFQTILLPAQYFEFSPLYHSCGMEIHLPAGFDSDQNAHCTVQYRVSGGPTWLKAYLPDRMLSLPTESFSVSLMNLKPNLDYEVRGEVVDSFPVFQKLSIPLRRFQTKAEPKILPTSTIKWVAPQGSGTDYTQQSPGDLATLIRAGLPCGTTVFLMDGIYETGDMRLNLNQTCDGSTPVIIMAAPGAKPILDGGYHTALNWNQSQNDSTFFSAGLPAAASYTNLFLLNGTRLFPYATVSGNIFSGNYHLAALNFGFDGFVRNDNSISLKTASGIDPRNALVILSQYFRCLTINGFGQENFLRIKGITFRYYGKSSVSLNGAFGAMALRIIGSHQLVIDSCEFLFNDAPIFMEGGCNDVTIQNCHIQDNTGLWSHAMFKKSVANQNFIYPTSMGRQLENSGILYKDGTSGGSNLVVRNNLIDGIANGIGASTRAAGIYNADIYGNTVVNCFDGLECDGNWSNLKIWGNDVSRILAGVSLAPPYHGPVYLYRNVFHHIISRENKADDPYHVGCQPPVSYFSAGIGIKTNSGAAPLDGSFLHFINNTFHSEDSLGYVMYSWDDEWEKIDFTNNIFYAENSSAFFFNGMKNDSSYQFLSDHDNYFVKNSSVLAIIKEVHGQYQCHEVQEADSLQMKHRAISKSNLFQILSPLQADPLFVDPISDDFSLQVGSPMIDAGVVVDGFYDYQGMLPDIGALESDSLGMMSLAEKANRTISIYPNPTDGELFISSKSLIQQVEIFDLHGKKLNSFEGNFAKEMKIDVGKWQGLIIISIQTSDGHFCIKTLVQ